MYQPPKRLRHGQEITPLEFNDLVRTAYGDSFVSAQPPLCCEWDSAGLRLWLDESALAVDSPPAAGEVCVIDGGASWVSACDPVTGSGGSFTTVIQITLPGGSTGPSFVVNDPGTTTNAYTITATSTSTSTALYPPGSGNPALTTTAGSTSLTTALYPPGSTNPAIQTTATGSTVTLTDYLTGTTTPWLTQTATATGGVLQFPVSTSAATAPVGLLSLPTMTVAGPPTWTPPAGTYPEIWDPADGNDYLWDGSAWRTLSTAPPGGGAAPAWLKVPLTYSAFSAAANTVTIPGYTIAVRGIVSKAVLYTKTAFAAPGLTNLQFTLLIAGNTTIGAYSGMAAGALAQGNEGTAGGYLGKVWSFSTTTLITIQATSTGALLNALTAGELELYVETAQLPAP